MMGRLLLVVVFGLAMLQGAAAQTAPFDMSPERPGPSQQPAPVAPPARTGPQQSAPPAKPSAELAPPGKPAPSKQQAESANPAPAAVQPAAAPARRYLIPSKDMTLYGETASRTWSINLTAAEAGAKTLHLGYQNAIVVVPEASRLTVSLNGTPVLDRQVQSSDSVRELSVTLPEGLLRTGANTIRITDSLRHRTDCSVDSTYQLWTRIDSSRTYLSFRQAAEGRYSSLDDIKAVGVDADGRTRFDIVVPGLDQPAVSAPLFRLAEGLAIHAGMPNQSFSISKTMPHASGPGQLTVVLGTASELSGIVRPLPNSADASPVAGFVPTADGKGSVLVISGPSWRDVTAAINDIVSPLDRPYGPRDTLSTRSWHAPDAPILYGGDQVSFADLGVPTVSDFSGRRFHTSFYFGIPSDFYASAYGKATILLDAAYSAAVEPGSRINVYVNGHIASTYPISANGGAILRHMPVQVTMRDFKPGLNVISLDAIITTKSDQRCLPGATADTTPRFALFDSSQFLLPRYARIAQRPNLAATSGTGFPYNRADGPIPLVMDSQDPAVLSSTATLLARLALAAGRPIPVVIKSDVASLADANALFVGPIGQMQSSVLQQLGISDNVRSTWGDANGPVSTENTRTKQAFQDWRERLRGGHWFGRISSFEDWLNRNFDISLASLRFLPHADREFEPDRGTTLVVAQSANPDDKGTWTLISAPTADQLKAGVDAITSADDWPEIAGHITTYAARTARLEVKPVSTFSLIATQPASLVNLRLIAANWLSSNTLTYAALFAIVSVILGMATAALLIRLGRRR